MAGLVMGVQAVLVSVAAAHPGPPGHTHGEDWPFGPLVVAAGIILSLLVCRKASLR